MLNRPLPKEALTQLYATEADDASTTAVPATPASGLLAADPPGSHAEAALAKVLAAGPLVRGAPARTRLEAGLADKVVMAGAAYGTLAPLPRLGVPELIAAGVPEVIDPASGLAELSGIGLLAAVITPDLQDECLAEAGAHGQRNRMLPAALVMDMMLALSTLFDGNTAGALDAVTGRAREDADTTPPGAGGRCGGGTPFEPARSSVSEARHRAGALVFAVLLSRLCGAAGAAGPVRVLAAGPVCAYAGCADEVCGALRYARQASARWHGRRVAAVDGTRFDLHGKPNRAHFGEPGTAAGQAAYGQALVLAMVDTYSRSLLAVAAGPLSVGERTLLGYMLACVGAGMVLLADAGFASARLLHDFAAAGCDLIWRMGASWSLHPRKRLRDGSYLVYIKHPDTRKILVLRMVEFHQDMVCYLPRDHPLLTEACPGRTAVIIGPAPARSRHGIPVAEACGTGEPQPAAPAELAEVEVSETVALITTLLSPEEFPAIDIAGCYHRRWIAESVFAEIKITMRGSGTLMRSPLPAGAYAEILGLACTYQASRILVAAIAAEAGLDPAQISFTHVCERIRQSITRGAAGTARRLAGEAGRLIARLASPDCRVRYRPDRHFLRSKIRRWRTQPPPGTRVPDRSHTHLLPLAPGAIGGD